MEALFLKIVNMSITACWVVLAVIMLRFLLKRAPRQISVIMWALVGVRLVCPFTFESVLSLIPSAETISPDIMMDRTPEINSGVPIINEIVNPIIEGSFAPDPATSANPLQLWIPTFAVFWILGIIAMILYAIISYIRIRRRVREAAFLEGNIRVCDNIETPFILGVFRPKIYIPSGLSERDKEFVLAHERAHIKRGDHLWKPLGFLLLAVYWFNPLLWVAYVLLCRDIELACDERVIKSEGEEIKKPYSEALINLSIPRRFVSACPLCFGEVGVKGRIKSVLNYKKPAFWVIVTAAVATAALGICFLSSPKSFNGYVLKVSKVRYMGTSEKGIEKYRCFPLEEGEWEELSDLTGYPVSFKVSDVSGGEIKIEFSEPLELENEEVKEITVKKGDQIWLATPTDGGGESFCISVIKGEVGDGEWLMLVQKDVLAKYPQFSGLSKENGVSVYVTKLKSGQDYKCTLTTAGADKTLDLSEYVTVGEMKEILRCYGAEKKDIAVEFFNHPISSYYWKPTDDEKYFVGEMLIGAASEIKVEKIVDNTKELGLSTDQALEPFYETEEYVYSFPSIRSNYVIVKYSDGSETTLETALKNGYLTVLSLDVWDIDYIKTKKEAS